MILCIGTTPTMQRTMVFNRLAIDDVNRAAEVHEHASGKSVNVARVLTTLDAGEAALAAGFAGGRRGDALLEEMTIAKIPHDFVRTEKQTRLCTTLIDRSTGEATELVEGAPPASAAEWEQLIERLDAHAPSAKAMVFSGTIAPGAPIDFCDRWIGKAPVVVIDARGEPMRRALRSSGRVIAKLNRQEFAETIGENLESEEELHDAMRRQTPANGWLIVTMGKAGAIASIGGELIQIHAPVVNAISPIGSGDAFTAGLVARLDDSPEEALKQACACGSANALTAFSGHLRREDVERLIESVRLRRVPGA
jgi:1-phosphofructokinase family hexose kinase